MSHNYRLGKKEAYSRTMTIFQSNSRWGSLSLKDKIKVIGLLKDKKSKWEIATLFVFPNPRFGNTFSHFQSRHPELDNSVLQWFKEMRYPTSKCKPLSLSRAHIQARAVHEAKLRGILNFKSSDG